MKNLNKDILNAIRGDDAPEVKLVASENIEVASSPFELSDEAQIIWDKMLPMLENAGLFASVDAFALYRYCELSVIFNQFKKFLHEEGFSYSVLDKKSVNWSEEEGRYVSDSSAIKSKALHPEVKELNKLSTQLLALEKEFGMTKVSRSRILGHRAGLSLIKGDPFNYDT